MLDHCHLIFDTSCPINWPFSLNLGWSIDHACMVNHSWSNGWSCSINWSIIWRSAAKVAHSYFAARGHNYICYKIQHTWEQKNVTRLHWEVQTKKNHTFLVSCVFFWSLADFLHSNMVCLVPWNLQLQKRLLNEKCTLSCFVEVLKWRKCKRVKKVPTYSSSSSSLCSLCTFNCIFISGTFRCICCSSQQWVWMSLGDGQGCSGNWAMVNWISLTLNIL